MSNMSLYIGEFVGTTLLLLLGNGVNMTCSLKHSYGKGGGWIVTSFGWGFSVMTAAYVSGWVSGAHFKSCFNNSTCYNRLDFHGI